MELVDAPLFDLPAGGEETTAEGSMTEPTCRTGKTCYPSPQAAWHAAGILRRKRLPRGRHMAGHNRRSIHAYRCRVCSLWHVTSSRSDDPRSRTA